MNLFIPRQAHVNHGKVCWGFLRCPTSPLDVCTGWEGTLEKVCQERENCLNESSLSISVNRHGTTKEQYAKVAEKNHCHSVNNPYAQFQVEYSLDEILASKEICDPITVSGVCVCVCV